MRDLPEDWRNEALQRAIAIEAEAKYGVPKEDEDD